ncbi:MULTISPECIES: MFS transporter [unclassified Amycolatopsis]|uniref:MFS transporter n=1 Tax=unclassified Amycolatopsis TaxID=2618356 RepID=UPI002876A139|nr:MULTISPECIES: MFS transporter [unclassified Amycolatopsis]MDS0135960.1 MFS transporter [Amycolatopsis sp. 505]MDS0145451.1 MFS transporter [Amycolatopsis sp. CM201R]
MPESPAVNRSPAASVTGRGPTAGGVQLLLLLAGSCLSVLGAVLIAPVLPQLSRAFAGTPGADVLVPIVLTAPALLIGLTAPFAGIVADRIDRKRLLLLAMLAYAGFGTAPLYLDSLGAILASRVLVGLCEGAIMTCCTTLIGDYWSGARRARYLSLQTLVATLSATVFLALGGVLGASGWRTPFWLYAVAAPLAIPMALKLWQPAPHGEPSRHLAKLPWRQLAAPCLVTLFGGVVFYALIVELSFVLAGVGVTATGTIGAISAIMSLATAAGAITFGRLSGKTPRALLPVEFGLSAVGLLIVFATASPVVITVGSVFTGFGTGMLLPTLLSWAVNRLTFDRRGRGTGLWTSTLFLGEFASPIALAAIGTATGGLQGALAVLGIASAIAGVLTAFLLRRNNRPLNVTEA